MIDSLSLEVLDNLAVARVDPGDLRDHWKKLDLTGADALVLSACVQMPSLASIQAVEDEAGIPVCRRRPRRRTGSSRSWG